MPITIKTKEEIEILREGGKRLAEILEKVAVSARPGVSTKELDSIAEMLIFESGGTPSFKGYKIQNVRSEFPASICVSINDEVVHAIPRADRILREGNVVALDIGMWWPKDTNHELRITNHEKMLCTDMAVTIGIGKISPDAKRLIEGTRIALEKGIQAAHMGGHIGDIGYAIKSELKKYRLSVVRELAGHGVGYQVHEEPFVPNFGHPGTGPEIREGMVLALEPISTLGDFRVKLQKDEWTFKTIDGSLSAHFEHTIAVTKERVEVLTSL